jgi:sugar lactone lactonase YvrE
MNRRSWTFVVGLTAALATGLVAGPAGAVAQIHCTDSIQGSAPTLHPEGIGYDPIRNRYLVGSVTHGTVSVVNPDGSVRTLVSDPALITTMGIAVDAPRGRVLVVNGDIGIGDRSSPATTGTTAGLGIYNLFTGRQIRYVNLGALDPTRGHFGNDVAVAPDGTAYVTDSVSGAVYRVPLLGPPTVLVRDDRLAPAGSGNGANGIVWHPNGFLLVAQSSGRALYRVAPHPPSVERVAVDAPVGAPDGLLLDGRDGLLAIDNTSANRVLRLVSPDGWHTAAVTLSRPWPDPAPTTMARGRCGVYVLTGRLDLLLRGTPSDEFALRRF